METDYQWMNTLMYLLCRRCVDPAVTSSNLSFCIGWHHWHHNGSKSTSKILVSDETVSIHVVSRMSDPVRINLRSDTSWDRELSVTLPTTNEMILIWSTLVHDMSYLIYLNRSLLIKIMSSLCHMGKYVNWKRILSKSDDPMSLVIWRI